MARAPNGKLKDEHKSFIVQRLACFDTPKEAAEALKAEFGISLSPQGAEAYDPTKRAARRLSQQWRDLFEQTRADFLDNAKAYIPIANKTVRLREMQRAFNAHKSRGNWVAAMQVLEQAAKESGDAFTNRRELTGKDGAPIKVDYASLSEDEINAKLANALAALGVTVPTEEEAEGGEA